MIKGEHPAGKGTFQPQSSHIKALKIIVVQMNAMISDINNLNKNHKL
jgi:hypothetical protein